MPRQRASFLIVLAFADASTSRRCPEGLGPLHRHEFVLGLAMYVYSSNCAPCTHQIVPPFSPPDAE